MGTVARHLAPLGAVAALGLCLAAPARALRPLATNGVSAGEVIATTDATQGVGHCQQERLPRGTSAVRLSLTPIGGVGPLVHVTVSVAERLVDSGLRLGGWRGGEVTVPLEHPLRSGGTAMLCMTTPPGIPVAIHGTTDGLPRLSSGPHVRVDAFGGPTPRWWRDPAAARAVAARAALDGALAALLTVMRSIGEGLVP